MCKMLVSKETLIRAGFPPYTASSILRQAKHFMVQQGYEFYEGRRVSVVPIQAIKSVIGDVELSETEE
ncbi:DUF3173 domain-containing protein [Bacillus velezensis]|nr:MULTISPECIES: DUF3173 family protein [Bacillus amyloliquefaciens group]APA01678.1 hypothetical protein BK055_03585 [Bacillus velezensis]AVB10367.1 DUF3173 domain-containing protein [Bacillus velezensis]WFP04068.1 DUF3173 family protein [Bacillus velezensis]